MTPKLRRLFTLDIAVLNAADRDNRPHERTYFAPFLARFSAGPVIGPTIDPTEPTFAGASFAMGLQLLQRMAENITPLWSLVQGTFWRICSPK